MRASVLSQTSRRRMKAVLIGRIGGGIGEAGPCVGGGTLRTHPTKRNRPRGTCLQPVDLGADEEEALRNLRVCAAALVQERTARLPLAERGDGDAVSRALGVLQAKMLGNRSFQTCCTVYVWELHGLISGVGVEKIDALVDGIAPATLSVGLRPAVEPSQRDGLRAEVVRCVLG